ncbi:hypothetical protein [Psychroserpens sp. S379A]|uniref:hypothetical protein n=1 Tax=Psychroserpens sp. S379A TaxID=3415137 RepID=UPI003C7E2A73
MIKPDLLGTVTYIKSGGRTFPVQSGYRANCNLEGETANHSYAIWFINKDVLKLGKSCECKFKFSFSDNEGFNIVVSEGQKIELNEGLLKVGELIIKKILNEKLIV